MNGIHSSGTCSGLSLGPLIGSVFGCLGTLSSFMPASSGVLSAFRLLQAVQAMTMLVHTVGEDLFVHLAFGMTCSYSSLLKGSVTPQYWHEKLSRRATLILENLTHVYTLLTCRRRTATAGTLMVMLSASVPMI